MKVYVAGHGGLVGSAIVKSLERDGGFTWIGRTRQELDLFNRVDVFNFIQREKPDAIIIAAARVGGIWANKTYPVEFLSENLQIQTNLMDAAHSANVERLLFLGSSCIYPAQAPQPIREEYLLTGPLEPTNASYAIAKIAGIQSTLSFRTEYHRRWISAMPTNLYGPGDNFDTENSHVLPAFIRKFHDAKVSGSPSVTLWGSGSPLREFLHASDMGDAAVFLLKNYDSDSTINVGSGREISILDLANLVAKVTGYTGDIKWDTSRPDGTLRKVLDCSRINNLGWFPRISLEVGIAETYEWFKENHDYDS